MSEVDYFEVNGVRVVNIKNNSGIALFGIGVLAGSNYETPEIAGISHFAEHMFFKGTKTKNWHQINETFAKLGVNNNAYTSNNEVYYHTTCPKENIEPVISLMLDMFFNSTFPEEELEKERGVIAEEKKMYEDDPRAAFSSALGNNFFVWDKGHDTIGTFESIASISRTDMINYLERVTNKANFIFICCGDIESSDLKKYIADNMPLEHPFLSNGLMNSVGDGFWTDIVEKPEKIKFVMERENITQSNAFMLFRGLSVFDNCHPTSNVLYSAIGGGMYSKLFSRIREELGLCYACGMTGFPISYPHHSLVELYSFLSPENVDLFIEEAEKVLDDIVKNGVDTDLFECAKTDTVAAILRKTETSAGKANYLLKKQMFGKRTNMSDIVDSYRRVKIEDCNALAEKLLTKERYWAVMNPAK